MKHTLSIALLVATLLAAVPAAAEREVLLGGEFTHGGFGGPVLRYTTLMGEGDLMLGGKGAWLVNHRFYIGGAGFGTADELEGTDREFGYGGVLLGYVGRPERLWHWNAELLLGAGEVARTRRAFDPGGDTVWVLEPGIGVLLGVAEFAEVSLGISYRLVGDTDLPGVDDDDLSGWSLSLAVLFGAF